jgi:glycosyltransferase involved in cell wall biosynthesis
MQPAARTEHPIDVLIVSLASTHGLRTADDDLLGSLIRAGVRAAIVRACPPAPRRTLMLTDLAWAWAARTAARIALAPLRGSPPRAVVYSSTTAALLWPRPGAIRFDACSAGNRPGRHGLWQRPLERRRLRQASTLLPWSQGALSEAPDTARDGDRALILPVPVEPSGRPARQRDIAAITYASNPSKKGLDRVLAAWRRVRGEIPADAPNELVVAGASSEQLRSAGFELDGMEGVRVVGALPAGDYRALVRRARVFVCAPRREDYGIAQLEALADGCLLVSTPAPGPYAALAIALSLDARLVGEDLEGGLRAALLHPTPDYGSHARAALAPFARDALDRRVSEELLPRLLG